MLTQGSQSTFIRTRANLPTAKGHADLAGMDSRIRAQSFFSARVSEAHILDRLREVSDGYSRGDYGLVEARNKLKDFLRAEGYDPHGGGMRNLASTGRLNLILKQNAAMARSAGEWARMHDPDAMAVFPYVRYHARNDSRTRDGHASLDGNIYAKGDPFLRTHTPPWEFNCRCWLEEITAKEAARDSGKVRKPTPPGQVKVESESGFSFDPAEAFEEFDLSSVKNPEARMSVHDDMVRFCAEHGNAATLKAAPPQKMLQESYREPENIEEIRELFRKVENRKAEPLKAFSVSVGKILPEHIQRLGLTDFNEDIVFKHEEKNKRVGVNHWEKNHNDTLKREDMLRLFRLTIWNPYAEVKEDIVGERRRLCFYVTDKDSGQLTNVWVRKDNARKLVLEIVDSWYSKRQYIDNLGSTHKKKTSRPESNRH